MEQQETVSPAWLRLLPWLVGILAILLLWQWMRNEPTETTSTAAVTQQEEVMPTDEAHAREKEVSQTERAARDQLREVDFIPNTAGEKLYNFLAAAVRNYRREVYLFGEVDPSLKAKGISAKGQQELTQLAQVLAAYPNVRIAIGVHTDNIGDWDALRLGAQQRAALIRDALVQQGVAAERIIARGYGPDQPIADNSTPEGQAINRRIELTIEGM